MDTVVKSVINGVDGLFREPKGCGEQTMILTAPIVYGMFYLRQTGQVTEKAEEKGTKWIEKGKLFIHSQCVCHSVLTNVPLLLMSPT